MLVIFAVTHPLQRMQRGLERQQWLALLKITQLNHHECVGKGEITSPPSNDTKFAEISKAPQTKISRRQWYRKLVGLFGTAGGKPNEL